jgi:hypothetical protein
VQLLVEVAVRAIAERGGFALNAAGHDVTTFDEHWFSLSPTPFLGKYLILWGLRNQ